MSDNFIDSVDKFDSGELTPMEPEDQLIKKMSLAAQVLGERELRGDLKKMAIEIKQKRRNERWLIGIAASISITVGTYFLLSYNSQRMIAQPLQQEEAPVYLDSANYKMDSLKQDSINKESLDIKN